MKVLIDPDDMIATEPTVAEARPARVIRTVQFPDWLRISSPVWVWVGITAVAVGFGLIALSWGFISDETEVFRQLPYVVSGGITGLGFVMVGVVLVSTSTRDLDARRRERQTENLIALIRQLDDTMSSRTGR